MNFILLLVKCKKKKKCPGNNVGKKYKLKFGYFISTQLGFEFNEFKIDSITIEFELKTNKTQRNLSISSNIFLLFELGNGPSRINLLTNTTYVYGVNIILYFF